MVKKYRLNIRLKIIDCSCYFVCIGFGYILANLFNPQPKFAYSAEDWNNFRGYECK